MEHMEFQFHGSNDKAIGRSAVLVGVVSSGNLEVLVEQVDLDGLGQVFVNTSATGFSEIWEAVINDFAARHNLSNLKISINDGGSTPAVVSLRLDQAMEEFYGMSS
jgi:malonate decarboxylase delta subunit